eukprot:gene14102-21589_t
MHRAAATGVRVVIETLALHGADLAAGWTPLHFASYVGQVTSFKSLMAMGSDVNAVDSDGRSPLHLAGMQTHNVVMGLVMRAGGSLETVDASGKQPLFYYNMAGRLDLFR